MKAGNNLHVDIIRYSYPVDDEVGGALPSGTVIYPHVEARIQATVPIPAYAIQGLETSKIMTAEVYPGTLNIQEYDQLQVVSPPNSPYYGWNFRIDTVQRSNMHPGDPRAYILLTLVRATLHGNDYQ